MGGFRIIYADGETELMRKDQLFDHWFVIQCIHRQSQGLPLTELEVTTLGHTLINLFIYWFWWYKPLGISFPIDIPSKKPRPQKNYLDDAEGQVEKKESKRNSFDDVVIQFLKPDNSDEGGGRSDAMNDVLSFMSYGSEANPAPQIAPTAEVEEKLPPTANGNHGKAPARGILAGPNLSDNKNVADEPKVDVEAAKVTPLRLSLYTRIGFMGIKTFSVSDPNMLSLFRRIVLSVIFFIAGSSFGAMHCLAWNSQFPTRAEQYIWQVSSLIVTIIGGTMIVWALNIPKDNNSWDETSPWITLVVTFVYSSARISLILALFQLRALPYAVYVTPSWSMFYPHIN